jgi:hypothetical protein
MLNVSYGKVEHGDVKNGVPNPNFKGVMVSSQLEHDANRVW